MNKKNKIHLIGNAHIDPVWLWRWHQGYAEIKASFQSALDRMKEFPEFVFTSGCASYYEWIEENAPEMFEEIKQRIDEGRWSIAGGMWNQPDCNIPSGESFVRHTLYSQRYFLEKFDRMARSGYNVDSFGHNGMLPQILKKSGMDYYVFQRPNKREKDLPGNVFWWESSDGSRVLTFRIPFGYGSRGREDFEEKIESIDGMAKEEETDYMFFYGVGNHGGGPTIANIKSLKRLQAKEDGDRLIFSSPEQYFDSLEEQALKLPIVRDDLQHHARGCYSAHWQVKADNRRAEHRLLTAEKFSSMAYHILDHPYPEGDLKAAWKRVMFNQFHDIMGGCSIKEALEDSREFHAWALHTGDWIQNDAIQRISWNINTMKDGIAQRSKERHWYLWENESQGTPFVVFNPLAWDIKSTVQVNAQVKGITDDQGDALPLQIVRGPQTNNEDKWNTIFEAGLPALGYRIYWVYLDTEFNIENEVNGHIIYENKKNILENSLIKMELEEHTGHIKSIYDKESNLEVLKGKGAVPIVVDIHHCDTWAHKIDKFTDEVGQFTDAKIKLVEEGPIRWVLRVTSRYNDSILRQDFILYRDKKDIEVSVKLDWREKHKMLKLSFPVDIEDPVATYEIPYGFIERGNDGGEEAGQQWVDITGKNEGKEYGLAVLNDSKYSFSISGNDMRITVANSSIIADHYGERDEWCEFLDQGIQEFNYTIVPHEGSWKDVGVVKKAYELNVKPIGIAETYHEGCLPTSMTGICITADNIIATVFKRGEDSNGYILRCYETSGVATKTDIVIPLLDRKWVAEFGESEIKTFWIPDDISKEIEEKNLIEK